MTPYQQTFIEMAEGSQTYDIDCLIIQKTPGSNLKFKRFVTLLNQKNVERTIARALFWVITKLESSFFKRHIQKRYGNKPSKLNLLKVELIWIEPLISKSGFIYRYSEKDITKIQGRELDLLIRFGSGILEVKYYIHHATVYCRSIMLITIIIEVDRRGFGRSIA